MDRRKPVKNQLVGHHSVRVVSLNPTIQSSKDGGKDSLPETATGKRANRNEFPENSEQQSLLESAWFHMGQPFIRLREIVNAFFFQFWEDEIADAKQWIGATIVFAGKLLLFALVFVVPLVFLLNGSVESKQKNNSSGRLNAVRTNSKVVQNEPADSRRNKQDESVSSASQLIAKFKTLEDAVSRSNMDELIALGKQIDIGQQLLEIENYQTQGASYLLKSSIDFALICFHGEFGVPEQVQEGLKYRPKIESAVDDKLQRLTCFADLILQITQNQNKKLDWHEIESGLQDYMDLQLDNGDRRLVRRLASLSKISNYFIQPNRISEIIEVRWKN